METEQFLCVALDIMELPSELYQLKPQLLFPYSLLGSPATVRLHWWPKKKSLVLNFVTRAYGSSSKKTNAWEAGMS